MRIVAISDTHTRHRRLEVPDGNVLIHAGDITMAGERDVVEDFNKWLGELPHKHKVVIGGNHDLELDGKLLTNATYLEDATAKIEGFKFYGSPCAPKFGFGAAFMLPRGSDAIKASWLKIPHDTDVLITHCPPQGILDTTHRHGESLGCADLANVIDAQPPKVHIFGHIHGGHGVREYKGTLFVNAAVVDEIYRVVNKPTVIDL